ncbi:MAG: magnesium transporter CorA family protein [Nitrosopumilus sp.]|nr:magnesium transporter CorA family protein [Nitrosopumilus sp.]CAI9830990.1 putative magnesium and cobalt transport protein CorA [Nitrosopumilaceae archaeon]MDA7941719.1 magnesium transporter CorA family protein [Nitrosopumilus sp.]MDA7943837.1 magnesium transporter CorA family protein [Nitrosopumilus sp.]MDA7944985.1 magnesium transporter CorA family protein [Nitrosopumilus sp.]
MGGRFIPRLRQGRRHEEAPASGSTEVIQGGSFEWVDMQNPDRADVEALAARLGLNSLNVEDCMTKFELPKLDAYEDHFFVLMHFAPLSSREASPKISQLSVFMGRGFLVTVHQGDLAPLVELARACRDGSDPDRRGRLMGGPPGALLHEIIDALVDDLLHASRRIIASLDEMEGMVFDEARPVARSIALLRREINRQRRMAAHLKRLVSEISESVRRLGGEDGDLGLYYDDVTDHIDKVIETLDESRETMEIYKDTDFVLSTEKTNRVLGMLTIIFTLAIPATVVGTFYGMNVDLPLAGASGPLGRYATFAAIITASAVPAAVMFAYFKKLGWIGRWG